MQQKHIPEPPPSPLSLSLPLTHLLHLVKGVFHHIVTVELIDPKGEWWCERVSGRELKRGGEASKAHSHTASNDIHVQWECNRVTLGKKVQ
jgi:hypothetical protein